MRRPRLKFAAWDFLRQKLSDGRFLEEKFYQWSRGRILATFRNLVFCLQPGKYIYCFRLILGGLNRIWAQKLEKLSTARLKVKTDNQALCTELFRYITVNRKRANRTRTSKRTYSSNLIGLERNAHWFLGISFKRNCVLHRWEGETINVNYQ